MTSHDQTEHDRRIREAVAAADRLICYARSAHQQGLLTDEEHERIASDMKTTLDATRRLLADVYQVPTDDAGHGIVAS